jgi:hypothetical protein
LRSLPASISRRLTPPINLSPAFELNSESSRSLHLRLSFPVGLRLAPPSGPPALPSKSASGSHRILSSPASPSG